MGKNKRWKAKKRKTIEKLKQIGKHQKTKMKRTFDPMKNKNDDARDSECLATLWEKTKKFNVYQIQVRLANRTKLYAAVMDKKKKKALTTFNNASMALQSFTSNNSKCGGGSVPDEAKEASETLSKCDKTASELCSTSNVAELNIAKVDECLPLFKAYTIGFQTC